MLRFTKRKTAIVRSVGRSINQTINQSFTWVSRREIWTYFSFLSFASPSVMKWKKKRTNKWEGKWWRCGEGQGPLWDTSKRKEKKKLKEKVEREEKKVHECLPAIRLKRKKKRTRKRRKNKNFKTKIKIWRWTKISSPCRAHVEVKTDAAERGYYRRTSSPRLLRSRWFTTMHDGERERKIRFVSRCVRRSKLISLKKIKKKKNRSFNV